MENLPIAISALFIFTTALVLYLFYRAANRSRIVLFISLGWLLLQGLISCTGFYSVLSMPPRFMLLPAPALLAVIMLFVTKGGKRFIDGLDARWLTAVHISRIPVELVLLSLFIYGMVPRIMTFEGRNFDILSGITAPFILWYGHIKHKMNRTWMLVWNMFCLLLLFNIVLTAVFALPLSIQQFGFERPNIAVLYFPFIWLPCFIVPVVLLAHLACIRKLFYSEN